ncbi:E3 ubiquitin-protein ligase RNF220-like isoform X1 [Oncorhynchus tshawytscha]|uniref:E3 ubiquitin-protein ligase RNF220 n=1 Tax=Oncorhynchus tshawytscha TaxID=74940 RepID=A0A8C8H833_ONCTS|nr:E3 ubiquitin-protein ligase RNF220-like isoform X1 [Oncorhynchus tshawytscha]
MDLHWPTFKMDSSSYLPGPLASPALMVLASTAKTGRDASVPCQAPRSFRAPIFEKDLPFPSGSYTFASMYNRQGPISSHSSFPARDFPASLLHLHPQFQFHPNKLDCPSLGMLNHIGVGAFRPFSSPPEEKETRGYQSAFTPAKRLKGCYTDSEGKEYDFGGGCFLSGSPGSLKAAEDSGRKLFTVSGLLSNREASSSPEDRKEHCKGNVLYDSLPPVCPVCHAVLPPGELQEHMEQEMGRLAQLQISTNSVQRNHPLGATKTLSLSLHIKCEGGSPTFLSCPPEEPHSDRYQTFLRVRTNRHARLNVDDWCHAKPALLSHLTPDCQRIVRIGKLKRRRPYVGQDILLDLGGEEWSERRRIRMTSILGGCEGSVFVSSSTSKEGRGDSDADLDVDGDDTLQYGRVQCTEADIPCSGKDPGEVGETLRGAVLNGGTLSNRVTLEHSKWTNEGSPSTSNGESNKLDNSIASLHRTCKNSDIDMVSGLTTLDSLRSRIRDLEKQLSRGDRHNCLICRDTYTTPLTSIQCWHAHCEECWLRTLGAKKLCPQCNTITSPGDLRQVFL